MNEDRDLLAEAAAHFAKAAAFWRDLQFQREIEEERRREDLVMNAEDENRRQWQQMHGQSGLNPYNQQPRPTVSYALRLSDEDVQRIAEAVVLRLRAEADYPR